MRKALIIALALLLTGVVLAAKPTATTTPVPARDFKAYKAARVEAQAAETAGNYAQAATLYLEAADLTPHKWVEAWQLNNAAMMILKSNPDMDKGAAQKALFLLDRALPLANSEARVVIEKNRLYCKRVLGTESWPKQ